MHKYNISIKPYRSKPISRTARGATAHEPSLKGKYNNASAAVHKNQARINTKRGEQKQLSERRVLDHLYTVSNGYVYGIINIKKIKKRQTRYATKKNNKDQRRQ